LKIREIVRDYPITLTVSVNGILANFSVAFTQPTFLVFAALFTGAVLVKGRHTVTRMILAAGVRLRHHARYHRFFSHARWEMEGLWKGLVRLLAETLLPKDGPIAIGVDDTAQRKTGAKIYGVGMVHDNRPAALKGWDLAWGLTWVVMTVMVRPPLWPNRVFAVPIGARLYRKKKVCEKERRPFRTKAMLALEMIRSLVSWLPERSFLLHVDGAYACGELMKALPRKILVVGRLRYDAALHGRPPKRRKARGRPRQRGRRLDTPLAHVTKHPEGWTLVELPNGKRYEVQSWVALWWKVFRDRPILVVASRRPAARPGERPGTPQFFYSTDLLLLPALVLAAYCDRWSIECLIHEAKERMGFEEPQCRTERAVERTTPFLLWTAGIVQYWFLSQKDPAIIGWRPRWRARRKNYTAAPTFSEMLAAMRREILSGAFISTSSSNEELHENLRTLIESAAYAA